MKKNNVYSAKAIKRDLKFYKELPNKYQMVEYATVYEKDGIKFLIQLHPDAPAMPRFSHSEKSIYVTLNRTGGIYLNIMCDPLAITVYENHLDSYSIHLSHTPFDKTKCHEHTSVSSGHKRIEYEQMPKDHIKLFNRVMKIGKSISKNITDLIGKRLDNNDNHINYVIYKDKKEKFNTLNKYYFSSKIHWTYQWSDYLYELHVIDGDEKKKAYLHGGSNSNKKLYFKTLKEAFEYDGNSDFYLYGDYKNGLECLKNEDEQFGSIQ